jgi:hypothetical protein
MLRLQHRHHEGHLPPEVRHQHLDASSGIVGLPGLGCVHLEDAEVTQFQATLRGQAAQLSLRILGHRLSFHTGEFLLEFRSGSGAVGGALVLRFVFVFGKQPVCADKEYLGAEKADPFCAWRVTASTIGG